MVFSCNIEDENMSYSFQTYQILLSHIYLFSTNKNILKNEVHSHLYYELCFVLEGEGTIYCNDKQYSIKKNCIFICDPFVLHQIVSSSVNFLKIAYFTFQITSSLDNNQTYTNDKIISDFLENHHTVSYNCAHIRAYFEMLSAYRNNNGIFGVRDISLTMLLDILIALSFGKETVTKQIPSERIERVTKYINDNILYPISIDDLCQNLHFSERRLFYFFKKYFLDTPNNYINSMKISASISYLKMGYSIRQVAEIFHFPDISSYSRLFKKHKGISPTKYLKNKHSL